MNRQAEKNQQAHGDEDAFPPIEPAEEHLVHHHLHLDGGGGLKAVCCKCRSVGENNVLKKKRNGRIKCAVAKKTSVCERFQKRRDKKLERAGRPTSFLYKCHIMQEIGNRARLSAEKRTNSVSLIGTHTVTERTGLGGSPPWHHRINRIRGGSDRSVATQGLDAP